MDAFARLVPELELVLPASKPGFVIHPHQFRFKLLSDLTRHFSTGDDVASRQINLTIKCEGYRPALTATSSDSSKRTISSMLAISPEGSARIAWPLNAAPAATVPEKPRKFALGRFTH